MKLNSFDNVCLSEKVYNLNLDEDQDVLDNLFKKYTQKHLEVKFVETKGTIPAVLAPVEIFYVNDNFFLYSTDRLYRHINLNTGTITASTKLYSESLKVIAFRYKGADETLLFARDNYIVRQTLQPKFSLPLADFGIFHANVMFLAKDNLLSFGKTFDKVVDNVPYTFDYNFSTQLSDGKIVGLMSTKNYLYVICQHSIYKLQHFGEDCNLSIEKLSTPYLDIPAKVFCDIGNKGYFVSCKKLYRLVGDKVELCKSYLNNQEYTILNKAFTSDGKYMLPIEVNNRQFTYCIDTMTHQECSFEYRKFFTDKGGYTSKNLVVCKVDFSYKDSVGEGYKSIPLDFGNCKIKTIVEVQADIAGSANLRLSGDYTDKILVLNNGCNAKKCSLTSKKFILNFENPSIDFYIKSIRIKYKQ